MIRWLRYLFGLRGVTGNRKVIQHPDESARSIPPYLYDSHKRLTQLQELAEGFKHTPQAVKMVEAHKRTKRIHEYLISKNRPHELELFHLQHTDHFINTFSTILATIKKPTQNSQKATGPSQIRIPKPLVKAAASMQQKANKTMETARRLNRELSQQVLAEIRVSRADIPKLALPSVAIDTFVKVVYLQEEEGELSTNEIGFTSAPEEKAAFIDYLSRKIGLQGISYLGNAVVFFSGTTHQPEMVPIIYWQGNSYALNLVEMRLYPVQTFKKKESPPPGRPPY